MAKSWAVNAPTTLYILYKAVSIFIESETREKIKLTKKPFDKDMANYFNPCQIP